MKLIISLFLLSSLKFSFSLPKCTSENIYFQFTPCSKNLTRNVYFSNPNQCDIFNFPLSQLNIECGSCPSGSKLSFDLETKSLSCQKCPKNTFSTAGNFRINGLYEEWTQENIDNEFENECFVVENNEENKYCTSFFSDDYIVLKSGNAFSFSDSNQLYIAQLSRSFHLIKQGLIKFKYKKDTKIKNGKISGTFRFFINYLIEINDVKTTEENKEEWNEISFNLQPGYYSFLWQYLKYVDSQESEEMRLQIAYIEVEGIETAATECKPCKNGFSSEGSDYCDSCEDNEYYDPNSNQCIQCPKGQYSPFGFGPESCTPFPDCSIENYHVVKSNACNINTNKQNISYELINANCRENNQDFPNEIECEICPIGKYLKINGEFKECNYCENGEFSNKENSDSCQKCNDIIKKVAYFEPESSKKFTKEIEIVEEVGFISLIYSKINPNSLSFISISIDNLSKDQNIISEITKIPIEMGKHTIKIKSENTIIDKIIISNSNEGGGYECSECPENMKIKDENGNILCQECQPGFELIGEKCVKCKENFIKISSSNNEKCIECPLFTKANENNTICVPFEVFNYKKHMQKYYLGGYDLFLDNLCKFTQNLCYKTLYGPIKDKEKNLFFISYKQPQIFQSNDFSYTFYNKKNSNVPAYVFLLKKNHDSNEKTLINLGNKINNIKTFKFENNRGLLFHYINGDLCNETNNYETYLLLKCKKESNNNNYAMNFRAPILIKSEQCKFYFEWDSKAGCPICLSNEINYLFTNCINYTRYKYFSENDNCIIQNTTGLKGDLIEIDNENLLINKSDSNILINYGFDLKNYENLKENFEDAFYVHNVKLFENCTIYEDYDDNIKRIVIIVVIIWVICLIVCVIFFLKYRKIKGDYMKLQEEPIETNHNNFNLNNNNSIGLSNDNKKNINLNEEKLDKSIDEKDEK